jgi:hypothetical protein
MRRSNNILKRLGIWETRDGSDGEEIPCEIVNKGRK